MIGAMFGSILDPDSLRITIIYIVIMLKPAIMLAIDKIPATENGLKQALEHNLLKTQSPEFDWAFCFFDACFC